MISDGKVGISATQLEYLNKSKAPGDYEMTISAEIDTSDPNDDGEVEKVEKTVTFTLTDLCNPPTLTTATNPAWS